MIKIITFTIIVIGIVIITFNIGSFFSKPEPKILTQQEEKKSMPSREIIKKEKDIVEKTIHISEDGLNREIEALLNRAEKLLQNSKDSEALLIYDAILKKIGNSNDPKLLDHFANVWLLKAFIYQIYPNNDKEAAIEAYEMVIEKFEKSTEPKFLKHYMNAKLQQARFLSPDEKLDVYDELIKKFKNIENGSLQEEIESLLISKSFDLMGENDEEAMQILDDVIERYQDKNANVPLPENIRFSILNNMELAIITDNDNDKYIELAEKFMSNSPDTKPLIDMLTIIKDSQDLNQDEALAQWKEEHHEYRFPDWSFQELERWAYKIEDEETKARVTQYINAFVNQKYNLPTEGTEEEHSSIKSRDENEQQSRSSELIYGDPYAPKAEEVQMTEEEPDENYIDDIGENIDSYEEEISEESIEEEMTLQEMIPPLTKEIDKERE